MRQTKIPTRIRADKEQCNLCGVALPRQDMNGCFKCDTWFCTSCDRAADWPPCACGIDLVARELVETEHFVNPEI